ncbi:hypothetical protein BJ875DRAFT_441622 [Amylocarpus encephaloides]|uniref:Uncharacterized protein n=1 Tax=Amylocarpus encephaloides TaxID=45428 RepID=A0A9P7YI73_9HELO|nr:hypothetical protein BJ875DRAFT_441622 [Amylocarpus encephaloides]
MVRIPWYARSMGLEEKRGKSKLRLRRRGMDSVDVQRRQVAALEDDSDSAKSPDDDSDSDNDVVPSSSAQGGGQKAVENGQIGASPQFGRKEEDGESTPLLPPPATTIGAVSEIVQGGRTLRIQTPETHSSRPIPTNFNFADPSPNGPAPASTTVASTTSSSPVSSQSSLQSSSVSSALSSQARVAPSSTFAIRTSSSTPLQALLPSSTSSTQQSKTVKPTQIQAAETASSLTSTETETSTSIPANFADTEGIQPTNSSSTSLNVGILLGIIAGGAALLLLIWFLVRRRTLLRKKQQEKEETIPTPTQGRQSRPRDGTTAVAPASVTEPSVHPSHFPAPPFSPRMPERLDSVGGEAVNGLDVHPSNLAMGASPLTPPPLVVKETTESQPSRWNNWRNSVSSVPKFRTIKSWVGDQRRRNDDEEVPEMPKGTGKWKKLEDEKTVVGSESRVNRNPARDSAFRSESEWTSVSQR